MEQLSSDGLNLRLRALDVIDAASLAAAATHGRQCSGWLDALLDNAGITSRLEAASPRTGADLRRTHESNVFGGVAVTNVFLALRRRSPAPRIVNLPSGLGSLTPINDPRSRSLT